MQIGSPGDPVSDFLMEWLTEPLEEISCSIIPASTKVFLNGVWIGIHRNPIELVRTLRSLRRQVQDGLFTKVALHMYVPVPFGD
jgi:DNA-directed RNA polymerase II subunit RPB2